MGAKGVADAIETASDIAGAVTNFRTPSNLSEVANLASNAANAVGAQGISDAIGNVSNVIETASDVIETVSDVASVVTNPQTPPTT